MRTGHEVGGLPSEAARRRCIPLPVAAAPHPPPTPFPSSPNCSLSRASWAPRASLGPLHLPMSPTTPGSRASPGPLASWASCASPVLRASSAPVHPRPLRLLGFRASGGFLAFRPAPRHTPRLLTLLRPPHLPTLVPLCLSPVPPGALHAPCASPFAPPPLRLPLRTSPFAPPPSRLPLSRLPVLFMPRVSAAPHAPSASPALTHFQLRVSP